MPNEDRVRFGEAADRFAAERAGDFLRIRNDVIERLVRDFWLAWFEPGGKSSLRAQSTTSPIVIHRTLALNMWSAQPWVPAVVRSEHGGQVATGFGRLAELDLYEYGENGFVAFFEDFDSPVSVLRRWFFKRFRRVPEFLRPEAARGTPQARVSPDRLRKFLRRRYRNWPAGPTPATEASDHAAAEEHFGHRITRQPFREARRDVLPEDRRKRGRPPSS